MALRSLMLLALLGAVSVQAANEKARVESLPDVGPLPSKWYSGYYGITKTKALHYVFIESESDPANDPVVVWFEGGPGCSSMGGVFMGAGPFVVDGEDKIIRRNPDTWQ